MPKNPEESSKNIEPTVTSSENQPIVVGSDADATSDEKHRKAVAPSAKQDDPVVAANTVIDQKAMEQFIEQARLASAKADKNDPNTNISWIPSFVKNLGKSGSTNEDEGSEDSTNTESDEDSSRPDSEASVESTNAETTDEGRQLAPLQPPVARSAMQFHPIFPQSMDIPPPLNQWHMYNQQKSFNAPPAPPPPRCPEPTDLPSIQAVKKSKRRKSSGKGKTPRKKAAKEKKEDDDRPIKAPELRELPTTAAPRTNFNQAPKSGGPSCQPNYCPPCAQAPNLPPCPPTMTVPSCSQPLSACIPPASAMPAGMQGGMGGGCGQTSGCAAAVSDPCNPCISGGYRMNNFSGGSCPDLYPPQTDICRPSNGYAQQQQQQQQCCPQPPVCPVELCEKSVCYCEKCENPDPMVPPQYNMQQWTCKFLRPIENGNGRGQQNYDGGFQMPQGQPGGIPAMPGCNGNGGGTMGPGGMGMGPGGMGTYGQNGMGQATMGPGSMAPTGVAPGSMPPGSMGPANSMGFNPMCNPVCNPNYGSQPQYQQPTGGRGCPPPGGYGSGCPPPGNPPPPPRCPVPCAPRCPPRTCYQKTFTDWGENDPRDALMSRITMYPPQRSYEARTPTPMTLRNLAMNQQMHPNFNPNAHTNMVAYHPELLQVTGAISAPVPRFDESIVPQSPRYSNVVRTPQLNAHAYKRPRSMYVKESTAAQMDMEPDLLSTRASQLRYHYSQQRRSDTPRVAPSKKMEIYNGDIDWKSEPKLHSSETVASKLRRQHNRNKLKEINDG